MKRLKPLICTLLITSFAAAPLAGFAAEKETKPKPYTLKTCPVSDEKLGEMGKPFAFTHEGREIKLCCKDCQKDFKKDPAKYIKKIEKAEAKAKEKKS